MDSKATHDAHERAAVLLGRVATACYVLGLITPELPELAPLRRRELAGILSRTLKAIEAADAAGAP